jgi:hypothetical protein
VAAQGATVIVTNSLVLARRNGAAGHVGVALVATPHGTGLQRASSAHDLVRWIVRDGKPPEGLDTPFPR